MPLMPFFHCLFIFVYVTTNRWRHLRYVSRTNFIILHISTGKFHYAKRKDARNDRVESMEARRTFLATSLTTLLIYKVIVKPIGFHFDGRVRKLKPRFPLSDDDLTVSSVRVSGYRAGWFRIGVHLIESYF